MDDLQPRPGLLRHWDTLIGPGATGGEQALILGVTLAATLGVAAYALTRELGWTIWQWLAALLLALDLFGGVVANGTKAARRWYHRPGQTRRDHFAFVAVHLAQIVIFGIAFLPGDWTFVGVSYAYLLIAAVIALSVPETLLRPITYALYVGALLLTLYVLTPAPPGLEWFLPILYFKLIVSHLGMKG